MLVLFFFSSRRRHTRCLSDWSSDVCSSDLILTGSLAAGTAAANHCNNWTSSAQTGVTALVGHHDRAGGGTDPMSWNSAHATQGCSATALVPTGGRDRKGVV